MVGIGGGGCSCRLMVIFCRSIEKLNAGRSVGFAALLQGWFSVFALQMCCKAALAVDVYCCCSFVIGQLVVVSNIATNEQGFVQLWQ